MIETEIKGDGDDAEEIPLRASVSNNHGDKIVDSSDECHGFKRFNFDVKLSMLNFAVKLSNQC